MLYWPELSLLSAAALLFGAAWARRLIAYRPLLFGGAALMLITALFPRPGNALGQYLFASTLGAPRVPVEIFGIAWWLLGAWLIKSLLNLVLRRTLFPDDNQPHARRLFADLASVLIYVVALVGIMETVFRQPISTVLATSGVLAIILGLALQNTLADVFSGLAINVERSFRAGDWISFSDHVEGQVIEVNWRATRIKTAANELVVIPNSVVAKGTITNHRRLEIARVCTLSLAVSNKISPTRVIAALEEIAKGSAGLAAATSPQAVACNFANTLIRYELNFSIDDFTLLQTVQSGIVTRVADAFNRLCIPIGEAESVIRLVGPGVAATEPVRAASLR